MPDHKLAEKIADEVTIVPVHDRSDEHLSFLAEAYLDLQARVADLELMLRAVVHQHPQLACGASGENWMLRDKNGRGIAWLRDDGTGLPLLTDEAREALSRKVPS
jgi:hypothetical protein